MTGPAPRPADAGAADRPPPLLVTEETDPEVRRAATALATGSLVDARTRFTRIVAEHPDQVDAQVGLVLSGWTALGPSAVERDLAQLVREYPDHPLPSFELGLVQAARGDARASRPAIGSALDLGRGAGDAEGLAIARLADDLLHEDQFRGYPPVLVAEGDVPAGDRIAIRRLRASLAIDDRGAAAEQAALLAGSASPVSRIAGIVAAYDKSAAEASATRATDLAGALPRSTAAEERDAVQLHAGLLLAWSGETERGCRLVQAVADGVTPSRWRRLASPISAQLRMVYPERCEE